MGTVHRVLLAFAAVLVSLCVVDVASADPPPSTFGWLLGFHDQSSTDPVAYSFHNGDRVTITLYATNWAAGLTQQYDQYWSIGQTTVTASQFGTISGLATAAFVPGCTIPGQSGTITWIYATFYVGTNYMGYTGYARLTGC